MPPQTRKESLVHRRGASVSKVRFHAVPRQFACFGDISRWHSAVNTLGVGRKKDVPTVPQYAYH